MGKMSTIINEMPALLSVQKEFYNVMISERKVKIIDYSMEQLIKLDMEQEKQRSCGQQFTRWHKYAVRIHILHKARTQLEQSKNKYEEYNIFERFELMLYKELNESFDAGNAITAI